ncbi:MAG TPA: hypothetical protein VE866_12050, partial [Candidatus Binatia bacterium]|nr:hypothetical protein [Candidatus Binatia bacterium]
MCSGKTHFLRLHLGIVALAAALLPSALAQSQGSSQNNSAAPPGSENPMSLPPRTSTPPPSVQQPEAPVTPPSQGNQTGSSITSAPNDEQGRFVFRKQVQEVVLHATVVDETGKLVTSLDRSAFSVYQNGQP